jgi:hypothetical protein
MVGRGVDYRGDSQPGGWKGTGFLVGPKLLLTNHHVLNSIEVARESTCQFNYVIGPDGKVEAHAEFRLLPDELILTSPYDNGLDYTFVSGRAAAAAIRHGRTRKGGLRDPSQSPTSSSTPTGALRRSFSTTMRSNDDAGRTTCPTPTTAVREARYSITPEIDRAHHARKANDNKPKSAPVGHLSS